MSIEITMPRLSDTMETGTIIKWGVSEGDAVSSGDVVADVETDKATMELSVYDDGTVAKILVGEGQTVEVGRVIAVLAEEGEEVSEVAAAAASGVVAAAAPPSPAEAGPAERKPGERGPAPPAEAPREKQPQAAPAVPQAGPKRDDRIRISPVARRLADEHDLDISSIHGSGPAGRIIKRDVLSAIEAAEETAASVPPSAKAREAKAAPPEARMVPTTRIAAGEPTALALSEAIQPRKVPLSNMRQTIARRLVESKTTIPHYQISMSFNMDPLLELRRTLNEQLQQQGVKLSVNDFLVRSCALAMHEHPEFNASWGGDSIIIHGEINIGVAISVGPERGGGLVVGVIRTVDQKSLRMISFEARRLAEKARTRGLSLEEMEGATFTISNLGMYEVDHFTAIINPPNSAILAVGAAAEKPVVRDGQLTIGREMEATLSCDHRVIDGAMGAEYLQTLKRFIENPSTLLV
jgi:pyruvate dehydrogenase E2 component (dihydrolipoamide acetyltransferase)